LGLPSRFAPASEFRSDALRHWPWIAPDKSKNGWQMSKARLASATFPSRNAVLIRTRLRSPSCLICRPSSKRLARMWSP